MFTGLSRVVIMWGVVYLSGPLKRQIKRRMEEKDILTGYGALPLSLSLPLSLPRFLKDTQRRKSEPILTSSSLSLSPSISTSLSSSNPSPTLSTSLPLSSSPMTSLSSSLPSSSLSSPTSLSSSSASLSSTASSQSQDWHSLLCCSPQEDDRWESRPRSKTIVAAGNYSLSSLSSLSPNDLPKVSTQNKNNFSIGKRKTSRIQTRRLSLPPILESPQEISPQRMNLAVLGNEMIPNIKLTPAPPDSLPSTQQVISPRTPYKIGAQKSPTKQSFSPTSVISSPSVPIPIAWEAPIHQHKWLYLNAESLNLEWFWVLSSECIIARGSCL